MFSTGHLIWITISLVLVVVGFTTCMRKKPPIKTILKISLVAGVISEVIKVFSSAMIVPMVDPVITTENGQQVLSWVAANEYTPYLGTEHLPLELCSMYLIFMIIALLLSNEVWRERLYALMFATGTIGGLMGIMLSAIAPEYDTTISFLTSVRAWQFFLYHAMIVMTSLYIGFSKESSLTFASWKTAVLGVIMLDVPSFYLNSVFSQPVYVHDKLVGVTHRMNFFSSYVNPVGLVLTEKWQWMIYLVIRAVIAILFIIILYAFLLLGKKGETQHG